MSSMGASVIGCQPPLPPTANATQVLSWSPMLTRAFLGMVFIWAASVPIVQPGLTHLVPLLLVVTVISTLALVSLNSTSVLARVPDSLRVQWLRSLGVPATGLSGSVPSLVLLTQPRR
jgi:hypothetical protein